MKTNDPVTSVTSAYRLVQRIYAYNIQTYSENYFEVREKVVSHASAATRSVIDTPMLCITE